MRKNPRGEGPPNNRRSALPKGPTPVERKTSTDPQPCTSLPHGCNCCDQHPGTSQRGELVPSKERSRQLTRVVQQVPSQKIPPGSRSCLTPHQERLSPLSFSFTHSQLHIERLLYTGHWIASHIGHGLPSTSFILVGSTGPGFPVKI